MPAKLNPSASEIAQLRALLADPTYSQRQAADVMGWPLRRVERLIPRLGLPTHPKGRFRGERDARWKGGRIVDKDGYALRFCPDHPQARKYSKYILEHRLVMEEMLGRYLLPSEVVHHRNKNKQDNRPANLELFASNADHLRAELTGHCPQWTPSGIARIRAAVRQWHATHGASARDARGRIRRTPRMTA